jgi:hypothetical protein
MCARLWLCSSVGLVLQLDPSDEESKYGVNFCDRDGANLCGDYCHDSNVCDSTAGASAGAGAGSSAGAGAGAGAGTKCGCRIAALLRGHVRVLRMDASQARGPCWARHIGQSLW